MVLHLVAKKALVCETCLRFVWRQGERGERKESEKREKRIPRKKWDEMLWSQLCPGVGSIWVEK